MKRRNFLVGAASMSMITSCTDFTSSSGRLVSGSGVEMIDAAEDLTSYIPRLKNAGVRTVARYYARARQSGIPKKRLGFDRQGAESTAEADSLRAAGFSIVSVYQYQSHTKTKFLSGLDGQRGPIGEARLDAAAALEQASKVGQTDKSSAIYFGVDFDFRGNSAQLERGILQYFEEINRSIDGRYKIGAYGNGLSLRMLLDRGLISYSWISASLSFAHTDRHYNSGEWTLFQNQIDRFWPWDARCATTLGLDTNIVNPRANGIGAWGNPHRIDLKTNDIFGSRRFTTERVTVRSGPGLSFAPIVKSRCRYVRERRRFERFNDNFVDYARNVRVGEYRDGWVQVDSDDDGTFDGYVPVSSLTADFSQMPLWQNR